MHDDEPRDRAAWESRLPRLLPSGGHRWLLSLPRRTGPLRRTGPVTIGVGGPGTIDLQESMGRAQVLLRGVRVTQPSPPPRPPVYSGSYNDHLSTEGETPAPGAANEPRAVRRVRYSERSCPS